VSLRSDMEIMLEVAADAQKTWACFCPLKGTTPDQSPCNGQDLQRQYVRYLLIYLCEADIAI